MPARSGPRPRTRLGRLPAAIALARATRPDLVYTWGTGITLGVAGTWKAVDPARHLTDIPVLFTMVSSPRGAGLQPPPDKSPPPNLTGGWPIAPRSAQITAIPPKCRDAPGIV